MTAPAARTHDALLTAAEALFGARGYAAVGIREIAERAGANVASIKYHFGSKRELYLATVRAVMARGERESAWALLEPAPTDADAAAALLARFVRAYFADLASGAHQSCSALMLWEAVRPSEAIDTVVREYIRPGYDALGAVIRPLLPRGADATLCARSVLGQMLHYRIFRSFIDRTETNAGFDADGTARHVTTFTLRGLGHDDAFIEQALAANAAVAAVPSDGDGP